MPTTEDMSEMNHAATSSVVGRSSELPESLERKTWALIEVLKKDGISVEDYHIALILISMHRDGLVDLNTSRKGMFEENKGLALDRILKSASGTRYTDILKVYRIVFSSITNNGWAEIQEKIERFDRKELTIHIPALFDRILHRISESQGRIGANFIQPPEVTQLICGLAELKHGSSVFNPFAGMASYGVHLEIAHTYLGHEVNEKIWAIGSLRLIVHGHTKESTFKCTDSVIFWPKNDQRFDLIVSTPPLRYEDFVFSNNNYERTKDTYLQKLILDGISSLKEGGKTIILISISALIGFDPNGAARKHLLDNDFIETVISLSGRILNYQDVPFLIIVLSKDKPQELKGRVRFLDAMHFAVKSERYRRTIDHKRILDHLRTMDVTKTDFSRTVSTGMIVANDFSLHPLRYMTKQIDGTRLRNIIEPAPKTQATETHGRLVKAYNLIEDRIGFKLNGDSIENRALTRRHLSRIDESCLLLSSQSRTLKPTYFLYDGKPIFITKDILAFRIAKEHIDPAFLVHELSEKYVLDQLAEHRYGSSHLSSFSKNQILDLIVDIPSLDVQRNKVIAGYGDLSDTVYRLRKERNILAHGYHPATNELASLKHTLGRPRQNILDWAHIMMQFMHKNEEISGVVNSAFMDKYGLDMKSALQRIKNEINFITEVLEKGENGLILEAHEKTPVSLKDMNSIMKEIFDAGLKFKLRCIPIESEDLAERGIETNRTLLRTLIDNVITNCQNHAFETNQAGNELVIELSEVDENLVIELRNNGKPFPKNFDKARFITKYSTTDNGKGKGIGGYDIDRIASYLGDREWELLLDQDEIYPVIYRFKFAIVTMN